MTITILHISDLHRDSESRITTTALLNSLLRDKERYVRGGLVEAPHIAVVSGDIIFGVRATEERAEEKLEAQYNEALEFLVALSEAFFGGDRERIILVPGNHDVSMSHVKRSLAPVVLPVDADRKSLLALKLSQHDTKLRWDWNEFSAWEIVDISVYNERLAPFAEFYRKFYREKREFSLIPGNQFSIHDFPELGIGIAGLSSCHENDLFNRTGRVHPDAIAQAMEATARLASLGRLVIGVWHHSIEGGPRETDYVDSDITQSLMDGNCSIGMHGHQHRPQLLSHRFTADRQRGISIISAGTLCGGARSLPSGRMRAYNLVSLDVTTRAGTVFVRQMSNTDFSSPVWGAGYVNEFGGTSIDFTLAGKVPAIQPLVIAGEGDRLLRVGEPLAAYNVAKVDLSNSYLRRIAASALADLGDWAKIIEIFNPPQTASEFILVSEAYEELNDWSAIKVLHSSEWATNSDDSAVRQRIDMTSAKVKGTK